MVFMQQVFCDRFLGWCVGDSLRQHFAILVIYPYVKRETLVLADMEASCIALETYFKYLLQVFGDRFWGGVLERLLRQHCTI